MNKLTPAQLMYISGYVPTSLEDIIEFAQGGIHIKPSHVGRFTEYKKRTGKTTEEALHSPDPHVRQMANFARNAAKWKHEFGGTPMLESDNQDYEHDIYDDKSGDMLRQKQKGVLLSFLNNPNPVVEEPEFSYKQQGGTQQEQIMQLIQMYAQLAKVDPKQLMQQLQQMPPEQQQAALQQMAEQVQSAQGQETMAAGGIPTQYRLRGENVNKFNDFTTNLGMLGEAGNLVTTASAIDNPIAQGIAGVAGLIGGLGTAVRGLSWGADKLFGNNNMKDNQKYQDYFSKMSKQSSKLPASVGKASTPKKGMFDVNTPTEVWNQSKPSNKLWDIYGAPQRNKEWDTYMSNQQILKNLPDFSKLRFGKGGEMIKRADGSYSRRGLWDNIRANKGSGKKPTKEMLEQERKIKAKEYGGGIDNPGFNALPEYVQEKIIANMQIGGLKKYKIKDERQELITPSDNTRTVKPKFTDVKKTNVRNKTDKEIIAERKAIEEKGDKAILNQGLNVLKPELWTRQNWSDAASGLGEKFRFFPNDADSFVDNYLNPFYMVGSMAESLGQSPLQAQQSNSYLPYVTSIGAPLAAGALAGIGVKGTRQFVNNLANPAAGISFKNLRNMSKNLNNVENNGYRLVDYDDLTPKETFAHIKAGTNRTNPFKDELHELRRATEDGEAWKYADLDESIKIAEEKAHQYREMADAEDLISRIKNRNPEVADELVYYQGKDIIRGRQELKDFIDMPEGNQGVTLNSATDNIKNSKNTLYEIDVDDYFGDPQFKNLDDIKRAGQTDAGEYLNKYMKPYRGKWDNLLSNKYGGLPKAQAGRNDLPFPVGIGNYADNMYDPYSMNIANGYSGANPSQSVYLSDEEVANQNGMYDGYAFPGGPISKINDTGKVNPNVINISGQQLALNGLTSLGAANQALGYLQNNNKYFERRQRDAGNTMFNEAINPIAAQGNYTTNAGPASNFQLNKNVYAQSLSRYGGKTKSYKAGGQYNVSEEELLQLMKDGAEIEFL